ncbi:MAG: acetyl-CoA carboxylase carboxyltransferase subunit alpha [Deltaproteobacteria bacterium]|nr:acetyl-CoA carboxylase carboxyltransferase subunit alpha [Deltaproteobacteria bacterium]
MELVLDFERPLVELRRRIDGLRQAEAAQGIDLGASIKELERQADALARQILANLTPWQRTLLSRHPSRPYTLDYAAQWLGEAVELHGDRAGFDDQAIVGLVGEFRGRSIMLIGHQKGRNTKENVVRNFGMALPDGYRKALRLMRLAERFGLPIVTLIDTPGAYPGIDAEARGQAEAIARNIMEMATLAVPVVCCVIGEGGSGGALALGVGNRVFMLENATYSVISPEGCAAILWHDRAEGPRAAEALKLTAGDCLRLGVADALVDEPGGGAHRSPEGTIEALGNAVAAALDELSPLDGAALRAQRYARFRALGAFEDRG